MAVILPNENIGGRSNQGRPVPPRTNYDAIFQNIQGNTNQIPGIASNIRNIGGDTDRIIQQNLGLGRGLTNVGSAVGKTLEGQRGIAGQLTNQDAFLRSYAERSLSNI